MDYIIIVKLKI